METLEHPKISLDCEQKVYLEETKELIKFLQNMKELLQIKDVDVFDFWNFISAYFKPKTSYEDIDIEMEATRKKWNKKKFST